jgi:hypothetical protein
MWDKLDKLIKAIPGLATSGVAVLALLTGSGLGHEKWEANTQKAAGVVGVIISIAVAVYYDDADTATKKRLIKTSTIFMIVMLTLDVVVGALQSLFARHGLEIPIARDMIYRFVYLVFCISIIWCIGCLALLIPKLGNNENEGE